jgi:lipid II:glycine glycyltransferase (peptidoglycan interpeptide bridge formation enzyme)
VLKGEFNWKVIRVISGDDYRESNSGAQILFRKLPLGFKIAYIPRGLVGHRFDQLLPEIDKICRANRTIFLKSEFDLWEDSVDTYEIEVQTEGFFPSHHDIQPPRTLVVDLTQSEDQILAGMKQKTRYNIRLAQRKGVVIRQTCDIDTFYQLMEETSVRDAFGVHTKEYYRRALELFEPPGNCVLLCAEYNEQPIAAIMIFSQGKRAWYFYGASSNQHRHLMAPYLLQWNAIQWAQERGCKEYDFWGVPDHDLEYLEDNFLEQQGNLWGVYRFKRGFGGELRRTIGAWDRVYLPILYKFYLWLMK